LAVAAGFTLVLDPENLSGALAMGAVLFSASAIHEWDIPQIQSIRDSRLSHSQPAHVRRISDNHAPAVQHQEIIPGFLEVLFEGRFCAARFGCGDVAHLAGSWDTAGGFVFSHGMSPAGCGSTGSTQWYWRITSSSSTGRSLINGRIIRIPAMIGRPSP